VGNEVNGDWTGRYQVVAKKLTETFDDAAAAGVRSALTLHYDVGCGDGRSELDPLAFCRAYVPTSVRDGLTYVFLSTWKSYFEQLHVLYPNALLGLGEIGLSRPVSSSTLSSAVSLMAHYYGLAVDLPYYVGGYFWWYYGEDRLPHQSKPLWADLSSAFRDEAGVLSSSAARQVGQSRRS